MEKIAQGMDGRMDKKVAANQTKNLHFNHILLL